MTFNYFFIGLSLAIISVKDIFILLSINLILPFHPPAKLTINLFLGV